MVARLQKPGKAIAIIDSAIAETRLTLDLWLIAQSGETAICSANWIVWMTPMPSLMKWLLQ